jgi:hypothetical protein
MTQYLLSGDDGVVQVYRVQQRLDPGDLVRVIGIRCWAITAFSSRSIAANSLICPSAMPRSPKSPTCLCRGNWPKTFCFTKTFSSYEMKNIRSE